MSWAEFRIRLFAYKRIKQNELELIRAASYMVASGNVYSMNPKKFPNTIDKFWKIEKPKDKAKQKQRIEALRQLQQEYLKKKQNG